MKSQMIRQKNRTSVPNKQQYSRKQQGVAQSVWREKVQLLLRDLIIQIVPSPELFRKWAPLGIRKGLFNRKVLFFFQRTGKCSSKTLLGTKTKMPNKQSLETSVGRRGGAGYRNTVQIVPGGETSPTGGAPGGAEERWEPRRGQAQGPREKKPGWGPLTQGKASGPKRGRDEAVPHEREKATRSTPPILVLTRNRGGKESRKKSQQGRGSQSNKCPRRLPKKLLVRGRKARHSVAASWPSHAQPLPHRTHSATRRSSAPVPSPAAPSSQHCRRAASASRLQPTLPGRKQPCGPAPTDWPRPPVTPRATARGFPPTPGPRLRSEGGIGWGSRAPPNGRFHQQKCVDL